MKIIKDLKRTIGLILANKVNKSYVAKLAGKVVVVTGGSKGLGAEICKYLVSQNAVVINLSRTESEIPEVKSITCDLTKSDEIENAVKELTVKFNKIDALINNAAITEVPSIEDIEEESIRSLVDTNIVSPLLTITKFLPLLKNSVNSVVINIGSKVSRNPNISEDKVLYAVSKYAIEGISNSFRSALRKYGIRVICILPGTINTQFSTKSGNFLSTQDVCRTVGFVIENENIDFENFVIKGKYQDNVG